MASGLLMGQSICFSKVERSMCAWGEVGQGTAVLGLIKPAAATKPLSMCDLSQVCLAAGSTKDPAVFHREVGDKRGQSWALGSKVCFLRRTWAVLPDSGEKETRDPLLPHSIL